MKILKRKEIFKSMIKEKENNTNEKKNNMRNTLINKIVSALIVMVMTMTNFVMLGANMVTYAAEIVSEDSKTSHSNIRFSAYLIDSNGNMSDKIEENMNSENLKLHIKIEILKEGYFNGNIVLSNSNFKLKNEILSEGINEIKDNTIFLSQINAGEVKEFDVGIEILKEDIFDLENIERESKLKLQGVYKDSTEEDIQVEGERVLTLLLKSPYNEENTGIIFSQDIITNKISNFENIQKRMVQTKITVGMEQNLYPIKYENIEIIAPMVNGKYPENVLVTSMNTLNVNDKDFTEDNWNYDVNNGKISIKINNEANEKNKVIWNKQGTDSYILTYIYADGSEIKNTDELLLGESIDSINSEDENIANKIDKSIYSVQTVKVEVGLYDKNSTLLNADADYLLSNEEKDGIISTEINNNENEIAKGKIYEGIEREFTENIDVNVTVPGIAQSLIVAENLNEIGLENVYQRRTVISKQNILEILGNEGKIDIYNAANDELVSSLTANTEADQNGNIIINYPENIVSIYMIFSEPKNAGKIKISNVKVIGKNNKNTVLNISSMKYSVMNGYYINGTLQGVGDTKTEIMLKDTQTSAKIEMDKTELSTVTTNKDVEIRVVMQTRDESNELFENPNFQIILPDKIQEIDVKDIKLIYSDELVAKSANLNGNILNIQLEGKQTTYSNVAIEGPTLIIKADIVIDKKAKNSDETLKMIYTNQNARNYENALPQGETNFDFKVVAYDGIITSTDINDYGIDVVNDQGNKQGELSIGDSAKTTVIENDIINNNDEQVSNVSVLGTFPTENAIEENNIDIMAGNVNVSGIDASRVKMYYSDNADADINLQNDKNGWTETITDGKSVKKYLAVVDKLDVGEEMKISYPIDIPENLEYNEVAKQLYTVNYNTPYVSDIKSTSSEVVTLATEKGAMVEATLTSLVGGEENVPVKEGELIEYRITVSNTGSEDISNVNITGQVPEGTVYTEEVNAPDFAYVDNETKKQVDFTIENMKPGDVITKVYTVRVQKGSTDLQKISNKLQYSYGAVTKETNVVENDIEEGLLSVDMAKGDAIGMFFSGYAYRFTINITNISGRDLTDLKVDTKGSGLVVNYMSYYRNDEFITENDSSINVAEIKAGETIQITINTAIDKFVDVESKEILLKSIITAEGNEIVSNQMNFIAYSSKISFNMTSEAVGEYVEANDVITYHIEVKNEGVSAANFVSIKDKISKKVTISEIKKDNEVIEEGAGYTVEDILEDGYQYLKFDEMTVDEGQTVNYDISVVVNYIPGSTEATEILNEAVLYQDSIEIQKMRLLHILKPEVEEIPNIPPEITLSQNNNNLKQIDVNVSDQDSNVDTVKWAEGSRGIDYFEKDGIVLIEGAMQGSINTSFAISKTGVYTVYAKDDKGDEVVEEINITDIEGVPSPEQDTIPPEITISKKVLDQTRVEVSIFANDNLNPIDIVKIEKGEQDVEYFQNSGNSLSSDKDGNSSVSNTIITENGIYTAYAIDTMGNGAVKVFEVTEVGSSEITDTIPPVITVSKEVIDESRVQITVEIEDNMNPIDKMKIAKGEQTVEYFENNGTELNGSKIGNSAVASTRVSENGKYTIYANDIAGNETVQVFEVTEVVNPKPEDNEPPEIEITQNGNKQNVEVSILVKDNLNPIEVVKLANGNRNISYFQSNGNELEISKDGNSATANIVLTENGTYTVYAKDFMGNETVKVFVVEGISDTEDPGSKPTPGQGTNIISGIAWLDVDENGLREASENYLSGIKVRILDANTNTFLKDQSGNEIIKTTNNNGFYSFTYIPNGEYILVFEYDTSTYNLTEYEKSGADSSLTSKVIQGNMTIEGQLKKVAVTEKIVVKDEDISNINIGLKKAKIFDLSLKKTVSRIVVQNSKGTTNYQFQDETLAKAEIDAKLINSTNVVVEYKIQVTNEGEVDGYVRNIVDYVSKDYKFSSEMNKDWYEQDGKLFNKSLANEKIAPGESKVLTLILTKQMNENNTGKINNTAEIYETYNEQGLVDKDSILANNLQGEDDMGSADVIFSIKTGQVVATIAIIVITITVLGISAFIIIRYLNKREF